VAVRYRPGEGLRDHVEHRHRGEHVHRTHVHPCRRGEAICSFSRHPTSTSSP
jgi:hypothetical protein